MSIDLTGTKGMTTDVSITGFTTPTYTFAADNAPSISGKQATVTAVGGTQTGVTVHSVSSPFTTSFFRPANLAALPSANPVTGLRKSIPRNKYTMITRKGVTPFTNAAPETAIIRSEFSVPAGSDTNDAANVKAAIAAHIAQLMSLGDSICTAAQTGVI